MPEGTDDRSQLPAWAQQAPPSLPEWAQRSDGATATATLPDWAQKSGETTATLPSWAAKVEPGSWQDRWNRASFGLSGRTAFGSVAEKDHAPDMETLASFAGTDLAKAAARVRVAKMATQGAPEDYGSFSTFLGTVGRTLAHADPPIEQIRAAAKSDPDIAKLLDWYTAHPPPIADGKKVVHDVVPGWLPRSPDDWMSGPSRVVDAERAPEGDEIPTSIARGVFEHLAALEALQQEKYETEHPVRSRVDKSLGALPSLIAGGVTQKATSAAMTRLAPEIGALPKIVRIAGSMGAFEAGRQGYEIAGGAQSGIDVKGGLWNIVGGTIFGRIAQVTSNPAAQAVIAQVGMGFGGVGQQGVENIVKGEPFTKGMGLGMLDAAIQAIEALSMPELSPAVKAETTSKLHSLREDVAAGRVDPIALLPPELQELRSKADTAKARQAEMPPPELPEWAQRDGDVQSGEREIQPGEVLKPGQSIRVDMKTGKSYVAVGKQEQTSKPTNEENSADTARALMDTLRMAPASPRHVAAAEDAARIQTEPLLAKHEPTFIDLSQFLDRSVGEDPTKRRMAELALWHETEKAGPPPPEARGILSPEQLKEGAALYKAAGVARLALGDEMVKNDMYPEAIFRELPPKAEEPTKDAGQDFQRTVRETAVKRANDALDSFLDTTTHTPQERFQAEDILRRRTESAPTGLLKRMPQGERSPYEGLLRPRDAARGESIYRELRKTTNELRRFEAERAAKEAKVDGGEPKEVAYYASDFDKGGPGPDGKPLVRGVVPEGYELSGGHMRQQLEGHYTPHVSMPVEPGLGERVKSALGSIYHKIAGNVVAKPPLEGREIRERLSRRTQSALDFAKNVAVDPTQGRFAKTFHAEHEALVRELTLRKLAEQGRVLSAEDYEAMRQSKGETAEAKAKRAELAMQAHSDATALKRADLSPEDRHHVLVHKAAIESSLADVENFTGEKPWSRLEGREWGDWEGKYVPAEDRRSLRESRDEVGSWWRVFRAVGALAKMSMIGLSQGEFTAHKAKNANLVDMLGVRLHDYLRQQPVAMRDALWYTFPELRHSLPVPDDVTRQFFADPRTKNFGGALDIAQSDLMRRAGLERRIAQAKERGESLWSRAGLRAEQMVVKAGELLHRTPVLGDTARFRRAIGDTADALATYRALREHGLNGTPMPHDRAMGQVEHVFGYRNLGSVVQGLGVIDSTLRYQTKILETHLTAAQRKAKILGVNVGFLFDKAIDAKPGSALAQAALVARGVLRMGLRGAAWVAPFVAIRHAMAAANGVDLKDFDKSLDDRYGYLPSPVLAIVKLLTIPTGREPGGRYTFWDESQVLSILGVARHFLYGSKMQGASTWQKLGWTALNKNIPAGAVAQSLTGRNFDLAPVKPGWGPDENNWPLTKMALTAAVANPIESLKRVEEQPTEAERRSALHREIGNVMGAHLGALRTPSPIDDMVDRWFTEGILGWDETPALGKRSLKVLPASDTEEAGTPEGRQRIADRVQAQALLDAVKGVPFDAHTANRKALERAKATIESIGTHH